MGKIARSMMQNASNGKYLWLFYFGVPIAENLQTSNMCIIAQILNVVHWARLQIQKYILA